MALKRAVPTQTEETTNTAADTAVKEAEVKKTEVQEEAAKEPVAAKEAEQVKETVQEQAQETEAEPEKEPEAEVQAEEIKPQEVAVKAENTSVQVSNTERQAGAAKQFSQEMAAQGFEGLNLTGMSFDRVKLAEATFQLGSEEVDLGANIKVNILSTRNIYIVRQYAGEGAELFYSYDKHGKTLTDGSSAQETLDKWLEDGYGTPEAHLDIKEYIEAMAQLKDREDEYDEHMISLSIPPASKDRLAGAFAVGVRKFNCAPGELVIECSVGKKIGTGEKAFRPWNFKAIGVNE